MVVAALGFVACSVLPPRELPGHTEIELVVQYEFRDAQLLPIQVPASREDFTVLELRSLPAHAGERFVDGRRLLVLREGTSRLQLHCRYRVYARDGELSLPDPELLFPGATRIRGTQLVADVP